MDHDGNVVAEWQLVYLARDLKHARRVALEVLDSELAVLGGERLPSEIRVTANLQHPNLLPLFDSGEAGGLAHVGRREPTRGRATSPASVTRPAAQLATVEKTTA